MGILTLLVLIGLSFRLTENDRLIPIGPFYYARLIFKPSWGGGGQPRYETEMSVVHMIRSVVGLIIVGSVMFKYGDIRLDLFNEVVLKFAITSMAMVPLVILTMVVLVLVARSGRRQIVFELVSGPGLALVAAALLLMGFQAFAKGGYRWAANLRATYDNGVWAFLNKFALAIVDAMQWVWLVPFLLFALWFAYKHMFRASDGHAYLPALMGPCFAIAASIFDIFGPGQHNTPKWIELTVSLMGVLVMIVLAVVEIRWLNQEGYSIREPLG